MKNKEELNAFKEEVETLNKKLAELSEEELMQVVGGTGLGARICPFCGCDLELKSTDHRKRLDWFYCFEKCGALTHFWDDDRWEKGYL